MPSYIKAQCIDFFNTKIIANEQGGVQLTTDLMDVARNEQYPPQILWACHAMLGLVLSQYQAGIDISTKQYSQALKASHQALMITAERMLRASAIDQQRPRSGVVMQ